jgi:hypothetical protein
MTRTNLENGGYTLEASDGYDIIALDDDGIEVGRAKNVTIPTEGTLLTWTEGPELPPELPVDERVQRIAQIQEELAALEAEADT